VEKPCEFVFEHSEEKEKSKHKPINKLTATGPEIDPERYLITSYIMPRALTQGGKRTTRNEDKKGVVSKIASREFSQEDQLKP
jgi:hypothetical protein